MIDVQQIALALRACTRRSLVIIDEFGKGTESHGKSPIDLTDERWCWIILCCVRALSEVTKSKTKSADGEYPHDILIIGDPLSW